MLISNLCSVPSRILVASLLQFFGDKVQSLVPGYLFPRRVHVQSLFRVCPYQWRLDPVRIVETL